MGYLYLDLETTGIETDNSITEIAASYYKDGKCLSTFDVKCSNLNSKINLDALKISKTSFAKLAERNSEEEALKKLFDWILSLPSDSDLEMVGVNPQFDFNFIKNRAKTYNIEIGSTLPYRLNDLGQDARLLVKLGLVVIKKSGKGNTLLDIAKALGVEVDETSLHSAKGDVELYVAVHQALLNKFRQALCACPPKKVENA